MSQNHKHIYHLMPQDMKGSILYPLNVLKNKMPEVAAIHIPKYDARPALMEKKLLILDCLWNDVLHFTAVPPEEIKKLYIEANFTKAANTVQKFIKIPIELLDPAKTVVYTWSKNDVEHFETREGIRAMRQFQITIPFDPAHMDEYATPSRNTVAYYKLVKRNQEKQFMAYHFVPHILYQGTINITGLEIIEV